jgi:phospholipid/cholesterol/gamma-HCH transport system substrate-binding protein
VNSLKLNLTLVGAFVLAALATLVVALAILAGRTGATDRYYTVYSNVAGLKFGTQVLYEGYPVGQVEGIEPVEEGGRVAFRVEFSVTHNWKIPEDSVARSTASGLLAPQTVAIAAGRSAQMLAPGQMVRPGLSGDLLASMSSVAGNVDTLTTQGLLPLVENLNHQITALGEIVQHDLIPLVTDARHVVHEADQHVPTILKNFEGASANLQAVSGRVDEVLTPERVAKLDALLSDATQAAQQMNAAMKDIRALTGQGGEDLRVGIEEFRFTMETVSRRSESFAENLDATARNLQDFSRQLRQNPGLLLSGRENADTEPPMREGKRK